MRTDQVDSADRPLAPQDVRERSLTDHHHPLLDGSPPMRAIRTLIEQIADTDATVLIRGETGVGKDLIARAVHAASRRRDGPFIKVNCAAIPSELLESELFGHEKAAFTGAYCRKVGRFEDANAGTICLDEIAELPLGLQAKLLHVLQDFRFSRVGGHGLIEVDTRVIAATNRDLDHAIACGEFRPDVYYRLAVVEIRIPPLRERKEEIPLLASCFLRRFNEQYRRHEQLSPEMMARLMEYSWPGNVRELENFIRRSVVLGGEQDPFKAPVAHGQSEHTAASRPTPVVGESLREIARRGARDAERKALREVLERVHWNRAEAARMLQVSYKTLLNKIADCELTPRFERGFEARGEEATMSQPENLRIIREAFAAWNAHDVDRYAALLDDAYVEETYTRPTLVVGREAARAAMQAYLRVVPDLHFDWDVMITSGDQVFTRWLVTGTYQGEPMSHWPSDRQLEEYGCTLIGLGERRIRHVWHYWETNHILPHVAAQ